MKLQKALQIATYWMNELSPFCDRIQIAGSIRREKPEVKDIELVCIPKVIQQKTLFDSYECRHPGFAEVLNNPQLTPIKGSAANGKYIQVHIEEHNINLDVFTANAENWGHILAIRTGDAEYSHHVLAAGWSKKGYYSEGGMLMVDHKPYPIREEEDLFKLIGVKYTEPKDRQYIKG